MSRSFTKAQLIEYLELFEDYHQIRCGVGVAQTPADLEKYLTDRSCWDEKILRQALSPTRKQKISKEKQETLVRYAWQAVMEHPDWNITRIRNWANAKMNEKLGYKPYGPRELLKLLGKVQTTAIEFIQAQSNRIQERKKAKSM